MATAKYAGTTQMPADFKEKELRAFLAAAGMSEQAFLKKFKDLRSMDDIAVTFHADTGRFGRAYRKAVLASGEKNRRLILKR
jgi:hypothetical protein